VVKTSLTSQILPDVVFEELPPDSQSRQIWGQVEYLLGAAPWMAGFYPSGQIPRIRHRFSGAAPTAVQSRIWTTNLNRVLRQSHNVATLTTRPLRRRLIAVFRSVLKRPRSPWKRGEKRYGSGTRTFNLEISISRETFGYFGKERGFFAKALPSLLCVLFPLL